MVLAQSVLHKGVASSELAEVMAVKEVLSWIKNNDWPWVELESDLELMNTPLVLVVQECRQLIRLSNKNIFGSQTKYIYISLDGMLI